MDFERFRHVRHAHPYEFIRDGLAFAAMLAEKAHCKAIGGIPWRSAYVWAVFSGVIGGF